MIQIGASLAAARRARGLDLRQAERLTCMRGRYLTALEEERFADLPGRTYARAFLRTYANALDLDADRLVAAFDEQQPAPEEPLSQEPRRLATQRRPLPFRVSPFAAVAAAAIVGVLAWSEWSNDAGSPSVDVGPPAAAAAPPKQAPTVHVDAARISLHQAIRPAALVVRATTGPCWVLARRGGPNGPVLAEQTLQPGQTLRFGARHVWLRLGAPWNVTVRRGAHTVPGAPGRQPVDVVA